QDALRQISPQAQIGKPRRRRIADGSRPHSSGNRARPPRKASDMLQRRKWPGVAAGLALAVAGPLVLTACGGAQGSSSTLTLGVITPATTFKAPDMNWGNESTYNQAVYDSLVQASPTGVIEPHPATAWAYNAHKTVRTMALRTGV